MRVHSTTGLVTNSSSETFSVRADDLAAIVKQHLETLLVVLGIDHDISDLTVEIEGHDDWLYDVANEVFAEMMTDESLLPLFESAMVTKWDYSDRKNSVKKIGTHIGEWGRSEWEDLEEGCDLDVEFKRRYEIEEKKYVVVNVPYSGSPSLYTNIVIKTGDKVLKASDIPGFSSAISRSLGY